MECESRVSTFWKCASACCLLALIVLLNAAIIESSAYADQELVAGGAGASRLSVADDSTIVESGTCGESLTWQLYSDGQVLITGSGAMYDYVYSDSAGSDSPFYSFASIITKIEISEGITSIGENAFRSCSSLASVEIPASVTSIGWYAFSGCTSLVSVFFAEGSSLQTIGVRAFDSCSSLSSISIPSTVTTIGGNAFKDCANPIHVDCSSSHLAYFHLINERGVVLEVHEDTETGYKYTSESEGIWVVGIARRLSFLEIPDKLAGRDVVGIGGRAFQYDTAIREVTFSGKSGIREVGYGAFSGCTSLTSVKIPESVTSIGEAVFEGCSSLSSVEIPASVTSIGWRAFAGCASLTSIEIPTSMTSIGEWVFSGCSSLTSIEIPASVTSIGPTAFCNCSSIVSVEIPASVTSIGRSSFSGCASLKSVSFAEGSSLRSIGENAFRNCSSLTSIEIPASVTSIGPTAFWACSSLTSIEIPESVTSIGNSAFYWCSSIRRVTIPACITKLSNIFSTQDLVSVQFSKGSSPDAIADGMFYGCSKLTSIEIPASVTSVGDEAFYGCSKLASIEIPASVTSIGDYAFHNCSSLESVSFAEGSSLGLISDYAFRNCSKLASIELPASVISIGDYVFDGCSALSCIVIPSSVTSIGKYTFSGCSSLNAIEIPTSVTSIGQNAFYQCPSLKFVVMHSVDTGFGSGCFCGVASDSVIYVSSAINFAQLKDNKNFLDPSKTDVVMMSGELHVITPATVKVSSATYTGSEVRPAVIVTLGGKTLKQGTDYRLLWSGNVNAGTAIVTAQGIGRFVGFVCQTFTVKRKSLSGAALTLAKASFTYNGAVQRPTIKTVGGKALKPGIDYVVSYSNASSKYVGSYMVTVTGKGNYAGVSAKATYKIVKSRHSIFAKNVTKSFSANKNTMKLAKNRTINFKKLSGAKAKTKLSFAKLGKVGGKLIVVNAKTGKVTLKKGLKRGVYIVKVKIKAATSKNYYAAKAKTVKLKVTVK